MTPAELEEALSRAAAASLKITRLTARKWHHANLIANTLETGNDETRHQN